MAKEKIPRQAMPEQAPEDRAKNFEEVPYGYTEELAILEAGRCLQCKKPRCVDGCPVRVDIPAFIALVEQGKFIEAALKVKEQNALPSGNFKLIKKSRHPLTNTIYCGILDFLSYIM